VDRDRRESEILQVGKRQDGAGAYLLRVVGMENKKHLELGEGGV
jgi:hypothetical protein